MRKQERKEGESNKEAGAIRKKAQGEGAMRRKDPRGGRSHEKKGALSIRMSMKKMAKLKIGNRIEKVAKGRIVDHSVLFSSSSSFSLSSSACHFPFHFQPCTSFCIQ